MGGEVEENEECGERARGRRVDARAAGRGRRFAAPPIGRGRQSGAHVPESRRRSGMPATERVFRAVLKHRVATVGAFALLAAFCALCMTQVSVNGDLSNYLPKDTPSTVAIDVMDEAFDSDVANLRVYASGIDLAQAGDLGGEFAQVEGVLDVQWLGDAVDVAEPLELQDEDTVGAWKDDEGYLFEVTLEAPYEQAKIEEIRALAAGVPGAQSVAIDGSAADEAELMENVSSDMAKIMLIAVATVLLLMGLATTSFLHPVVALVTIGVAVVVNMGTNIVQGEVSSVTQLIAAVLQLAVSMDYSIVMLANYQRISEEESDPFEAMVKTMCKSFPVVASSAAVTFFGFLSLTFMSFLLGVDMGMVLAKGVAISFVCVSLLMPCLMYLVRKPAARLTHRPLFNHANGFARVCRAASVPAVVLVALLVVPAYVAQDMTSFNYGSSNNVSLEAQVSQDARLIDQKFGESQTWVVLVPQEQWGRENQLVADLQALDAVRSVTSYSTVAGSSLPWELADEDMVGQLIGGGYSRLVVSLDAETESEETFSLVEQVRSLCAAQYGDDYHLLGDSVSTYDIKQVTTADSLTVRFASIGAIGLVLLLMFRSIGIPVILIAVIEAAIWINLSIPYFLGQETSYIGFLVIDAVQLGAAVDYSIIYAHEYLELRRTQPARDAARRAIAHATVPILTSSGILMIATLGVYFAASSPMVQELGMLICRGALISDVMIFLVLPSLFVWLDRPIRRTSLKLDFFEERKPHEQTA